MGPKAVDLHADHDLFRTELVNLIDQRHKLVRLSELIDWQAFADAWSPQFVSTPRAPCIAQAPDDHAAVPQARLRAQRR